MIEEGGRISDAAKCSDRLSEKRQLVYRFAVDAPKSPDQHARGENRHLAGYPLKSVLYGGQVRSLVSSRNNHAVSARQSAYWFSQSTVREELAAAPGISRFNSHNV